MNWEIKYKKDTWKFISKNKLVDKFEASIKMFIKGEGRIDLKKLAGKLEGHYAKQSQSLYFLPLEGED